MNSPVEPVAVVGVLHGDPESFGTKTIYGLRDLKDIPVGTKLYAVPPHTEVDQVEAFRKTIDHMDGSIREGKLSAFTLVAVDESLSPPHLIRMLDTVERDNTGSFTEGKLGRWLGWAQASIVGLGLGTLNDFKEINKSCKVER